MKFESSFVLNVEESKLEVFFSFEGCKKPTRRLGDIDIKAPKKNLWLLKWCSSYYLEAKHRVEAGELCPTGEEEAKLDDLSEPGFVLEKDCVLICLDIDHYYTVVVADCVVGSRISWEEQSCILRFVSWFRVKSWKLIKNKNIVNYDIQWASPNRKMNHFHSAQKQAEYMFAATVEQLKELQGKGRGEAEPVSHRLCKSLRTHYSRNNGDEFLCTDDYVNPWDVELMREQEPTADTPDVGTLVDYVFSGKKHLNTELDLQKTK
ncbi:hypothetical protein ScPMuIL_011574 [Solemya velum]